LIQNGETASGRKGDREKENGREAAVVLRCQAGDSP
jgi:hypothetical protein